MNKSIIEAKDLSFHPAQKPLPLYSNLNITLLSNTTYFLIGDNGCGKSTLGKELATISINVHHHGIVGYLSQELTPFVGTVAEKLNIAHLLQALERMENGEVLTNDFELLENNWDFKSIIKKQLVAYNLPSLILGEPYTSLSGGMRTRINLLALERQACDFYILDEPSNHLDTKGRLWLMDWVRTHSSCFIITHDLMLLEKSKNIFELDSQGLHFYGGSWQDYLSSKKQHETAVERKVLQAEQILREQHRAKQTSQEALQSKQNKAQKKRGKANQSKLILNKKKATSEAASGRLSNLHNKRINDAKASLSHAQQELHDIKPQAFRVSKVESQNKRSLILSEIVLPYVNRPTISLQLAFGEHLWLSGDNGSGKSTLLKVIQGELEPQSGKLIKPNKVTLLDQHFCFLNHDESVLDNFTRLSPGLGESEYRTILAQLRMRRESALQKVSTLSGGECLKLALACVFSGISSPPLLLLDEPDNHLDLSSKKLLAHALKQYEGSIIIVSHDTSFINAIGVSRKFSLN